MEVLNYLLASEEIPHYVSLAALMLTVLSFFISIGIAVRFSLRKHYLKNRLRRAVEVTYANALGDAACELKPFIKACPDDLIAVYDRMSDSNERIKQAKEYRKQWWPAPND